MFAPLTRQSLADAVFQQLSEQILQDRLPAGDELPAERILAEQLGINRGAVREGLKRLQQAALVTVRHGGATQILDWRQHAGLELLPQLLLQANGQISAEAARGIMSLRSTLAPAIAAAAAARGDEALANALQSDWDTLAAASDARSRQQAALAFWARLVEGSGNIAFQLAFNSMNRTYTRIQDLLTQILDVEFSDTDNLAGIIRAVREQDRDAAARHAAAHIARGEAALHAVLDALPFNRSQ